MEQIPRKYLLCSAFHFHLQVIRHHSIRLKLWKDQVSPLEPCKVKAEDCINQLSLYADSMCHEGHKSVILSYYSYSIPLSQQFLKIPFPAPAMGKK